MHICEESPYILTRTNLDILPRTFPVVDTKVEWNNKYLSLIYEIKTNSFLSNKNVTTIVPFVLLNLSTECIYWENHRLSRGSKCRNM